MATNEQDRIFDQFAQVREEDLRNKLEALKGRTQEEVLAFAGEILPRIYRGTEETLRRIANYSALVNDRLALFSYRQASEMLDRSAETYRKGLFDLISDDPESRLIVEHGALQEAQRYLEETLGNPDSTTQVKSLLQDRLKRINGKLEELVE